MKWRRSDMTSPAFSKRGILSHAIGSTLRQFRLLPVVFLLVFALAIPCTLLDRSDMGWLGKEAMFYSQLSAYMLWFLLPAAGLVTAFSLFYFLFRSRAVAAYFSLGISRDALFAVRYLTGAGILVGSLLPNMLASLVINVLRIRVDAGFFLQFLYLLAVACLAMLVPYTLAVLVITLCGTLTEAAAHTAVWLCAPHLLGWAAGTFLRVLLPGSPFDGYGSVLDAAMDSGRFTAFGAPFGFNTSLFEWSAVFGPLTFFATDLKEARCYSESIGGPHSWPPLAWWKPGIWLLALGAGAVLAWRLFCRRKGERAGFSGQCVGLTAAAAALAGLYGYGLVLSLPLPAPLLMLIGSVVFALLFCLVCLVAFRGFSRMKRIWAALPAFLGALVLAGGILCTGGFGFSGRVPAPEEVEKVEMNAANDTLFLRWMHTFAGEEDLETVTALHRLLADQGRPTLRYGAAERYEETTMRVPIHIRYTLKDGRTLCRTFDVLKAQTLEKLLELDQTDCIREERVSGTRQMIRDDAASLVLTDAYFQAPVSLELDFWERAELARCIREDMAAQDIEERYFPESDARMLLLLEAVLEDGLPQGARDIIPLTSAYPRTLAYLEQKGLPVETRNPAVKRIVLHPYDPSTRKAAFGGSVVLLQTKSTMDYNGGYFDRGLTEESPLQVPEDRIEELLPALRSSLYASRRLYMAQIVREEEQGERTIYKWVAAEDIPAGILPD